MSVLPEGRDAPVELSTLDGGLRVVTETMPARSVAIGFYVGVGSRDEPGSLAGSSHFLEHLLFKGTLERQARDIAAAVDAVGGEMNAFTTREHTAFYVRVPAEHASFALELLADVVAHPAFRPAEIDAEREVILEELLQAEDTPDDVVHMRLWEAVFPGHPLGRETLGTPATIEVLDREAIAGFHRHWYRPERIVVAAAGAVSHAEVVDAVATWFTPADLDGDGVALRVDRRAPEEPAEPLAVEQRATEQVHVALGWRGVAHEDPERFAAYIANHVVGGGMSSRLFQEVREARGLAYTVYSSMSLYSDSGAATVYAGTAPDHLDEVLGLIDDVLDGVIDHGITDDELRVAQGYLRGSLVLGLEDTASRMGRLGGSILTRGEVMPVDEYLARVDAVGTDQVHAVVRRVFDAPRTLAVTGPFAPDAAPVLAAVGRGRAG